MSIQSGNLEEFLTVADVAEMLKLNQQTVRNWIDQGSLPAHRVGRRVRIRRSDLDRLLDEGYTVRTAPSSAEPAPSAEDFWGGESDGLADPWDGNVDPREAKADPRDGNAADASDPRDGNAPETSESTSVP